MLNRVCSSGCAAPGEHLPDCQDDSCRGCAPSPAYVGVLCARCWGRLQAVVRRLMGSAHV